MIEDCALKLRPGVRHVIMGLEEIEKTAVAGDDRVDEAQDVSLLGHGQVHCSILGTVLVPEVEDCLLVARLSNRGNAGHLIANRLHLSSRAPSQVLGQIDQAIQILGAVGHPEPLALARRGLDQHDTPVAANVNDHSVQSGRGIICGSRDGDLLGL